MGYFASVMYEILKTFISKCNVVFEVTGAGLRLTGTGLFGILVVAILISFVASRAPYLMDFVVQVGAFGDGARVSARSCEGP
jgi:hypothetical protein